MEEYFPFSRLTYQTYLTMDIVYKERLCWYVCLYVVVFFSIETVSFQLIVNWIPDFNEFVYFMCGIP